MYRPGPTPPPDYPTCDSGSPLAATFAQVFNFVEVYDGPSLSAALTSLSEPTIIQLTETGTYVLDKAYTVNTDLCIQVR